MSTPQYAQSPYRVLCNAYFEAGKIEEGEEPNSEKLAWGMLRLNDMMNLWQTQGLKLWLQQDLAITLLSNVGVYSIGPTGSIVMSKPTRIVDQNYYQYNNGQTRPVYLYGREDWNMLGQKGNNGPINTIFVDKQQTQLIVNTWLIPDTVEASGGKLHVIIQQQQPQAIALTDSLVFGPEWFLALVWGMAEQLASGSPAAIINRCKSNALQYRAMLEDWDVEDATTQFAPDARMMIGSNKFL